MVLANVPSFRFSFRIWGNMRTYPRFRFSFWWNLANVPLFRFSFQGNIRQNHPFGKPPFSEPPKFERRVDYLSTRKKNEPKPKLVGPDIFGRGGGLPREGVGAKKFGMSLETREVQFFFGGISLDFAGISQGCPKSLRKKGSCSILVPYQGSVFLSILNY